MMIDGTSEPRIGVFVCHCGHNIAGTVDVVNVAEMASILPYVVYSTDHMFVCSDNGQQLIKDKIKEYGLNRIVVASCSPRMHEPTFRRVVEEAGLNRYVFEQVNLREHVSWCHMHEKKLATEKAADLVRMAVARASELVSLPVKTVSVTPRTLIVGGGIAGMTAALDIANRGFEVVLVERRGNLGGHLINWTHIYPTGESGADIIEPLEERIRYNPNIAVHTNSVVVDFEGYIGNFVARVRNNLDDSEIVYDIGTVIVATGFEVFKPFGYYGYGESPNVITLAELQELEPKPKLLRPSDGKRVRTMLFISCVGSREPGKYGHEHCSRHCCFAISKAASDLRESMDEVIVVYRSLRTYGKHHEAIHRLARARHVIYSRYLAEMPPVVEVDANKEIVVKWRDILANEELSFRPDLLVLASAMIAPHDINRTGKIFGLSPSADGFFSPEHIKLAPLTTHAAGIMIAGTSQAAKTGAESAIDASGAAAKAVALMARGQVEIESTVPQINSELCSGCRTCVVACPYSAISMEERKGNQIAVVTDAKCHGCGTCAGACPSNAISMLHSTDEQILAMVSAFLNPSLVNRRGYI